MALSTIPRQALRASPKVGFLVALCLGVAWPAAAQAVIVPKCGPAEDVARQLADDYGEAVRATGRLRNGSVVELWLSEEARTFTVITRDRDGRRCVWMFGDSIDLVLMAPLMIPGNDT